MLINISLDNCFAFNKEVFFTMEADMRIKRFPDNIFQKKVNIVKSAIIYGPNNTGKTNFIKSIVAIKHTLLNESYFELESNVFNDNSICKVSFRFLSDSNIYQYTYWYDAKSREYIYEKFIEVIIDEYNNEKEVILFLRDTVLGEYDSTDVKLKDTLKMVSKNNILIYTIDITQFEILEKIKNSLVEFGEKILVIDMNNIRNYNTLEHLKERDNLSSKIVELIKKADLYLDDYYYEEQDRENEDIRYTGMGSHNMISVYKNKKLPSFKYDSVGTKKFSSLAGYIVDSINMGKIIFVDEIDSSLHFKLTRAIVSLFNNFLNQKAQLICTSHDISLLDCKTLFRKEQIWFTNKTEEKTEMYSLKKFSANEDGIREDMDLVDKYSKGFFCSIPDPDLIEALYDERL